MISLCNWSCALFIIKEIKGKIIKKEKEKKIPVQKIE